MNSGYVQIENCCTALPDNSRWLRHRFLLRFSAICLTTIGVFSTAAAERLVQLYVHCLATVVGALLKIGGLKTVVVGRRVLLPGVFGIDIAAECSGVVLMLMLVSGVLAYPASNRMRLNGIVLAVAVLTMGNIVRLAMLFWIGVHSPGLFDIMHSYVWNGISYAGAAVVWLIWLRQNDHRRPV